MAIGLAATYLSGIGGARVVPQSGRPSHGLPLLHITPVRVTARNGPIDAFGFLTNGIRQRSKHGGRRSPFVVNCHGKCTDVTGADWSADGSLLVYSTACGGGCASMGIPQHGIHVLNVRTHVDRVIVHAESFGELSVSADGSQVAYSDGRRLHVVPADGTAVPRTLVSSAHAIGKPTWSPAGDWIAYPDAKNIYLIRPDGSDRRRLTAGSVPAWSPDGRWIAYFRNHRLRLITPDGRYSQLVPGPGPCWRCWSVAQSPDWSPDGRKIAYFVYGRILVVTIASGVAHRRPGLVRFPAQINGLTWRPG
jgi:dipeptidyl aminopeptidase/acylaminoacyl peptidase